MGAWHIDPEFFASLSACVCGYVGGSFLGLLMHEGGHALAGWMVGLAPRAIVIGRGPILWRHRFRRTWLVIHAWPLYGFAARLGDPDGRLGAQAFVVAAGPAASLLLCAIAWLSLMQAFDADQLLVSEACLGIAILAVTHLCTSLWPRRFRVKERPGLHATDGWKLIRLARGRDVDDFKTRYAQLLRTVLDEREASTPPSRFAPELLYQVTRPDKTQEWARADAAEVLVRLLDEPALSEAEHAFILRRYKLDERAR